MRAVSDFLLKELQALLEDQEERYVARLRQRRPDDSEEQSEESFEVQSQASQDASTSKALRGIGKAPRVVLVSYTNSRDRVISVVDRHYTMDAYLPKALVERLKDEQDSWPISRLRGSVIRIEEYRYCVPERCVWMEQARGSEMTPPRSLKGSMGSFTKSRERNVLLWVRCCVELWEKLTPGIYAQALIKQLLHKGSLMELDDRLMRRQRIDVPPLLQANDKVNHRAVDETISTEDHPLLHEDLEVPEDQERALEAQEGWGNEQLPQEKTDSQLIEENGSVPMTDERDQSAPKSASEAGESSMAELMEPMTQQESQSQAIGESESIPDSQDGAFRAENIRQTYVQCSDTESESEREEPKAKSTQNAPSMSQPPTPSPQIKRDASQSSATLWSESEQTRMEIDLTQHDSSSEDEGENLLKQLSMGPQPRRLSRLHRRPKPKRGRVSFAENVIDVEEESERTSDAFEMEPCTQLPDSERELVCSEDPDNALSQAQDQPERIDPATQPGSSADTAEGNTESQSPVTAEPLQSQVEQDHSVSDTSVQHDANERKRLSVNQWLTQPTGDESLPMQDSNNDNGSPPQEIKDDSVDQHADHLQPQTQMSHTESSTSVVAESDHEVVESHRKDNVELMEIQDVQDNAEDQFDDGVNGDNDDHATSDHDNGVVMEESPHGQEQAPSSSAISASPDAHVTPRDSILRRPLPQLHEPQDLGSGVRKRIIKRRRPVDTAPNETNKAPIPVKRMRSSVSPFVPQSIRQRKRLQPSLPQEERSTFTRRIGRSLVFPRTALERPHASVSKRFEHLFPPLRMDVVRDLILAKQTS